MKETLDKKDKPFIKHLVKKLKSGSKTHAKQADDLEKAMNEDKHGDHEPEMIRNQLKTAGRASKRIVKHSRKKDNFKAWVQSKITKASDYLDTAADYLDSKEVNEEGLRAWFGKSSGTTKSGRKVKGWVQVGGKYDGKPLCSPTRSKNNS
jgi:antibiotic biosynthesis monooxygenase (ABM) superfamily enzyme